jgi:hypothetical protein
MKIFRSAAIWICLCSGAAAYHLFTFSTITKLEVCEQDFFMGVGVLAVTVAEVMEK